MIIVIKWHIMPLCTSYIMVAQACSMAKHDSMKGLEENRRACEEGL